MIASITGIPIKSLNCADACAVGAAMIAACGAEFFDNYRSAADSIVAVEKVFEPITEQHTYYNDKFEKYDRLWSCLNQYYKGE